jgi:regulatory protein
MSEARAIALRLLTRRDYTAKELRTRLLDRELSEDEVNSVLADLTAEGIVDDRRVAESFVRVASTVKGRGRIRISRELEQRGVDRSTIRDALTRLPVEDETETLRKVLSRKRLPARLDPAEHRRLFAQLVRRGFSADLIAKALRSREPADE